MGSSDRETCCTMHFGAGLGVISGVGRGRVGDEVTGVRNEMGLWCLWCGKTYEGGIRRDRCLMEDWLKMLSNLARSR
jgi:hypothetical protein